MIEKGEKRTRKFLPVIIVKYCEKYFLCERMGLGQELITIIRQMSKEFISHLTKGQK